LPSDPTFLKELSWDVGKPVDPAAARQIVADMRFFWSAELDAATAMRLAPWAVQVWSAPNSAAVPVRPLRHGVKVDGNIMLVSIALDDQVLAELTEVGGSILIDVQCDSLLDKSGHAACASLSPILNGNTESLVPGGLLRVGLMVQH
jgi:hypothetical protein